MILLSPKTFYIMVPLDLSKLTLMVLTVMDTTETLAFINWNIFGFKQLDMKSN